MKKRYFIYIYHQLGNIGRYEFIAYDGQPKEGFKTENQAEKALEKLIKSGKEYYFDRPWYKYVIMKSFIM